MSLQLCLAAAVSCLFDLLLHPPARPVWAAAAIGWIGWPLAVEPLCARVHFFNGGGWITGTTAVCVRHVHCASKHRVSSVLLGLCAVGFDSDFGVIVERDLHFL